MKRGLKGETVTHSSGRERCNCWDSKWEEGKENGDMRRRKRAHRKAGSGEDVSRLGRGILRPCTRKDGGEGLRGSIGERNKEDVEKERLVWTKEKKIEKRNS